MTTDSAQYNLQIQANKEARNTNVRKYANKGKTKSGKKRDTTVAGVLFKTDSTATAEKVRAALQESYESREMVRSRTTTVKLFLPVTYAGSTMTGDLMLFRR